jgi:hypothetical protein
MEGWSLAIAAGTLAVVILTGAITIVWKIARSEAALSAKIYQVEIWARDEFVRKGSFEIVIARMETGFRELRAEIAGRLDSMSTKIDHIRHPND